MVGLIDYGMGNLLSVRHALEYLGADVEVLENPERLGKAERLVLPGVGAFGDCARNLRDRGFPDALRETVQNRGTPLLGICLGMQIMADKGFESGGNEGLGWIRGDAVRIPTGDTGLRLPHVGWNEVRFRSGSPLFRDLPDRPDFYFVHSYHLRCEDDRDVDAICDYGTEVTAAVRKGNIFATQFHPEKSQDYGLKVLDNFLKWKP